MKNSGDYKLVLLILLSTILYVGCSSSTSETETTTDPSKVTDVVWEWGSLSVQTGFDNETQRPIIETMEIPNPVN